MGTQVLAFCKSGGYKCLLLGPTELFVMAVGKRRREEEGLVVFASHPSFPAISLWYYTTHRPRLDNTMRRLHSAALVALFVIKLLRWRWVETQLNSLVQF